MSRYPIINPLRKRGIVALNGRIHGPLNTQARNSDRAYYPKIEGSDAQCYTEVMDGSVAFTMMHVDHTINALMHHNDASDTDGSGDNNHVMAIDCLNGLGEGERCNESIMRKIVVLGIVERRSVGDFFNIIRQGVLSVVNTGDRTIYNGDDVMVYAQTKAEIGDYTGPIRLQLRPFDRALHGTSPKPVYQCLKTMMSGAADDTYMPAYKRLCTSFYEGSADIGLIAIGAVTRAKLEDILATTSGDVALLEGISKHMNSDAFKGRFVNSLFVQHSENQVWLNPKNTESALCKRQSKAVGRYMRANDDLKADIDRLCVGKSHSTALPGQPMMLQVKK